MQDIKTDNDITSVNRDIRSIEFFTREEHIRSMVHPQRRDPDNYVLQPIDFLKTLRTALRREMMTIVKVAWPAGNMCY